MDDVVEHLVCSEMIEQTLHTCKEQTVLATAKLLGHDNAGMMAAFSLPPMMECAKSRML